VLRSLVLATALLIAAPGASAARADVTVQASPAEGAAPLHVTLTASGASAAHWDLGDGTSADGLTVEHVYAAGRWTATATLDGTSTQTVVVTAYGLTLNGPRAARYGRRILFRGALTPAEQGVRVTLVGPAGKIASSETNASGAYVIRARVRAPGKYTARSVRASSEPIGVRVALPQLRFGVRGPVVALLAGSLRRLHFAAPHGSLFDSRLLDAVYAFQKVRGLPRTGTIDARFWRALSSARTPSPRYAQPANHLEVNKPRQVLYVVRRSRVSLIVPVSTAGLPGRFTPVGRFSIYRKVVGFDPSPLGTLYDPMYFTGGYAIHGNPSVPPFPASHGCVRVPMWIAPLLYATNPYGETVYVY
jgi:peptidoglycan hydrolase-like protein with peptidoglycan-binding domain